MNTPINKMITIALDLKAENVWLKDRIRKALIYVAVWYDSDSMEKTEKNLAEFLAREKVENESLDRM